MEILNFLKKTSGYGNGDGSGYGDGYGSGDGYGYGNGDGDGYGDGSGYGYGSGYGEDILEFENKKVYLVDNLPTIITNVFIFVIIWWKELCWCNCGFR